jgi:hypothetical protein
MIDIFFLGCEGSRNAWAEAGLGTSIEVMLWTTFVIKKTIQSHIELLWWSG